MSKKNSGLTGNLVVRVDDKALDKFKTKTKKISKHHSDFIREIIDAFNEDRLKITPKENQLGVYKNV